MSIQFTQFLRPDGRTRIVSITRPNEIEEMADAMIKGGYKFEIEELSDGSISMEICITDIDSLASGLCKNGPDVLTTVDLMIQNATAELHRRIGKL